MKIRLKNSKTWVPCKLLDVRLKPIRKKGQSLGTWTSKRFIQKMCLISFTTPKGIHHTQWVKANRVK